MLIRMHDPFCSWETDAPAVKSLNLMRSWKFPADDISARPSLSHIWCWVTPLIETQEAPECVWAQRKGFWTSPRFEKPPRGLNISVRLHAFSCGDTVCLQAAEMDNNSWRTSRTPIYSDTSWRGGPVGLKEQHWGLFSSARLQLTVETVKCKSEHITSPKVSKCVWENFTFLSSDRADHYSFSLRLLCCRLSSREHISVLLCIKITVSVRDDM